MTITKKPLLHKGSNKYYGLTAPELRHLYNMGLLKSIAYVYLALKLENPWCDRPVTIDPKEFAFAWGIPQSTLYRAIAKLVDQGLVKFGQNKLNISWVEQESSSNPSTQPHNKFSKVRIDSQKLESILRSENKFSEVRINSQKLENEALEPLLDEGCHNSHTLHTDHTSPPPYSEGEEKILKVEKIAPPKVLPIAELTPKKDSQKSVELLSVDTGQTQNNNALGLNNPKDLIAKILKVEKIAPPKVSPDLKKPVKKASQKSVELPADLRVRLQDLDIEVDQTLIAQVNQYHLSQAYGALYHVESTKASIDCPKAVFFYQLPKQPIEKLGDRLGSIALKKAIAFEREYEQERNTLEHKQAAWECFASIKDILARSKLSRDRGNNRI